MGGKGGSKYLCLEGHHPGRGESSAEFPPGGGEGGPRRRLFPGRWPPLPRGPTLLDPDYVTGAFPASREKGRGPPTWSEPRPPAGKRGGHRGTRTPLSRGPLQFGPPPTEKGKDEGKKDGREEPGPESPSGRPRVQLRQAQFRPDPKVSRI
jgi:hypothetical protein